jgi:hypothetical protein
MMKIAAVALIAALVLPAPLEAASQATPTTGTPSASPTAREVTQWLDAEVRRWWLGFTQPLYFALVTEAYQFDTAAHAGAALPWVLEDHIAYFGYQEQDRDRVAGPKVGDESFLWQLVDKQGDYATVTIILVFRIERFAFMYEARQSSGPHLRVHAEVPAIIENLTDLGEATEGKSPSPEPPHKENGVMVGGLFDLLPGFDDVPTGLEIYSEEVVVR